MVYVYTENAYYSLLYFKIIWYKKQGNIFDVYDFITPNHFVIIQIQFYKKWQFCIPIDKYIYVYKYNFFCNTKPRL